MGELLYSILRASCRFGNVGIGLRLQLSKFR